MPRSVYIAVASDHSGSLLTLFNIVCMILVLIASDGGVVDDCTS